MKTVSRHEFTVSWATDHQFVLIPKGIIEFKHFLTAEVDVNKGEDQSARTFQAHIRKMIELELTSRPGSDNILSKILADIGMPKARRTVSK